MKIAFWFTTPKKFDPANLDNEIFGGAEISAICLAKELAIDNTVYLFGNCVSDDWETFTYIYNGIILRNYSTIKYCDLDVLIVVRPSNVLHPANLPHRPKVVILWTGDESSQPTNQILWEKEAVENIDLIVTKSNWQRQDLLDKFLLLDSNQIKVMYNGFDDSFFIDNLKPVIKPKFICASTIYRGVYNFVNIWPEIKERIPDATLDIFASTKLYDSDSVNDNKYKALFEPLSSLDGITLKDPIPHNKFLINLQNYYAMLYPNLAFNESSCGVVLEAFGYRVQVVTSYKAGLKETIDISPYMSFGISPDFEYKKYCNTFINIVEAIWKSRKEKEMLKLLKQEQRRITENYSWKIVSKKWFQLLETLLKKSKGSQKSSLVSLADIPRTQDLRSTIITH